MIIFGNEKERFEIDDSRILSLAVCQFRHLGSREGDKVVRKP